MFYHSKATIPQSKASGDVDRQGYEPEVPFAVAPPVIDDGRAVTIGATHAQQTIELALAHAVLPPITNGVTGLRAALVVAVKANAQVAISIVTHIERHGRATQVHPVGYLRIYVSILVPAPAITTVPSPIDTLGEITAEE